MHIKQDWLCSFIYSEIYEVSCFLNSFVLGLDFFDKVSIGYNEDEVANPNDMKKYYSMEEQECYGVLAIEIKLIVK